MPPRAARDHSREHGQYQVMDAEDVQLNLRLLAVDVEAGDGAERGRACIGAQDGHVALRQFGAELGALGGIDEIDGAHLDGHAVAFGQRRRQRGEYVFAAGGDDQVMPAGGELGGQGLADVLGGAGDDGARVGTGSGYGHGPNRRYQ